MHSDCGVQETTTTAPQSTCLHDLRRAQVNCALLQPTTVCMHIRHVLSPANKSRIIHNYGRCTTELETQSPAKEDGDLCEGPGSATRRGL